MTLAGVRRLIKLPSVERNYINQSRKIIPAITSIRSLNGLTNAPVEKGTDLNQIKLGEDIKNGAYDPYQLSLMQEECILVDENDKDIGCASKRVCHTIDTSTGKSPLHRAFSFFIFNSENKLLLQQRSDTKITFPGLWTNSCCSHPLATLPTERNDSDDDGALGVKRAAQRRIFNELGILPHHCPVEKMTYLTRILYNSPSCDKWGEHELDYILLLKDYENVIIPDPNPNEIKDIRYVGKDEIDLFLREQKVQGGPFEGITPWFKLIVHSMLPTWWENIDNLDAFKNHENIIRF